MKSLPRVCSINCSNSWHSPQPSEWPVPRQSCEIPILRGFLWQQKKLGRKSSFYQFWICCCLISHQLFLCSPVVGQESRAPSPPSPACSSFHSTFPYSFCICPRTELSICFMWEFPQIPFMNSNFAASFLSLGKQHRTWYSRGCIPGSTQGCQSVCTWMSTEIPLLSASRALFFGLFLIVLNKELRSYTACCIVACRAAGQGKAAKGQDAGSNSAAFAVRPHLRFLCGCIYPRAHRLCSTHVYLSLSATELLFAQRAEGFPARPFPGWISTMVHFVGNDAVWHSHPAAWNPRRNALVLCETDQINTIKSPYGFWATDEHLGPVSAEQTWKPHRRPSSLGKHYVLFTLPALSRLPKARSRKQEEDQSMWIKLMAFLNKKELYECSKCCRVCGGSCNSNKASALIN